MFAYSSMESHSIATPEGQTIRETIIKVENGKGTKTVVVKGPTGILSDTMELKPSELKNIEKRKFMPGLFRQSMKNIKGRKPRKHKTKKGWLDNFLSA